ETNADGAFTVVNIPFHTYEVKVARAGFQAVSRTLSLRSNVTTTLTFELELESAATSVQVSGFEKELLVDPEETGTHAQMNQSDIEKLALQSGNRGLEAVLVSFPGFSQNANGAIHPRGAHNQMTYVIDGMPVSDQLTGAFANAVDPNIVQTVELFTGNIPAEYGNKISAVANITTKSGQGSGRRFGGSVMATAAGFDTLGQVTQFYGETGKWGYSGSVNAMKTNRYLDQVSLDNLHNGGHSLRGFLRGDYTASQRDVLRFNLMAGSSPFQLANLRSQHANEMSQRQLMRDTSGGVTWVRTIDAKSTYEAHASLRAVSAQLFDSAGDTPVTASQSRRHSTFTVANRYNTIRGVHNIRAGFDFQRFPVRENFSFAITEASFNDPNSGDFNANLLPFDLTRGGTRFYYGDQNAGRMYSAYAQDNVRLGRWQLMLGLRYDAYRFLANGNQWQPRVGVSYHLKETGTVLRASYNRTYQTPPIENLLLSNSSQAAALAPPAVQEALGNQVVPLRPERQNFYEVGLQQALWGKLSLNASYYHKDAHDQQDNNNFFNTGIIFPITLARIRVNGAEGRIAFPQYRGFSGTVSFTHARAISTPPFTGGLFIGNEAVEALSSGPFVIDHDQELAVQGILHYANRRGFYASLSVRHDSGLVANPSDPTEVARDPDYADLLPYVNLLSTPARTRPRTISDIVLGYEHSREGKRRWDASVQISNLTNRTALYNFQSIFVGTRLVQPRTAGVRLRWYF
ncbi:MAG: TonB-dependent receptor, partial [Bryobacter sp.]|nr:TonB-dependent receptor [Bryobacter sp.]